VKEWWCQLRPIQTCQDATHYANPVIMKSAKGGQNNGSKNTIKTRKGSW